MATTYLTESLFKVKAAPVPDVSLIPAEPGAIALNEADGFIYIADNEGWKKLTGTLIP